jgi:hypothetical protein
LEFAGFEAPEIHGRGAFEALVLVDVGVDFGG